MPRREDKLKRNELKRLEQEQIEKELLDLELQQEEQIEITQKESNFRQNNQLIDFTSNEQNVNETRTKTIYSAETQGETISLQTKSSVSFSIPASESWNTTGKSYYFKPAREKRGQSKLLDKSFLVKWADETETWEHSANISAFPKSEFDRRQDLKKRKKRKGQ